MSYDLELWSPETPRFAELDAPGWLREGASLRFASKDWQILCESPLLAEPEDAPAAVASLLVAVRYLTRIHIEPLAAPTAALQRARKVARALAQQTNGAIYDPQDDSVTTAARFKRFAPPPRQPPAASEAKERSAIVELRWWFTDGPLLTEAGVRAFLALLQRSLPEALPHRYGEYEPPQFRLDEQGISHFVGFLLARRSIVWYTRPPVGFVSFHRLPDWGVGSQGFRCSYVTIHCDAVALAQPGWQQALRAFWECASSLIRPFYGEVRTLGGYIRRGSRFRSDRQTEHSPVRGPFWRGIPRDPGHACVLGPPYLSLWPAFAAHARIIGDGLAFVSRDRWLAGERVIDETGDVPEVLAQPGGSIIVSDGRTSRIEWDLRYSQLWPFEPLPDDTPG